MKHGLKIDYNGITESEFRSRADSRLSVLSGTNNSGKSLVLKELFAHYGQDAYLCGTNRYYAAQGFSTFSENSNYRSQTWESIQKQLTDGNSNKDPVVMPFRDVFVRMADEERNTLFKISSECLGEPVELVFKQPGNSLSSSFLQIGGTALAKCSSGSRMLIHLLSVLVSKRFKYVLLDEPELGLTPRIQNRIQRLLTSSGDGLFEHLDHVFIATHSHIFLNRKRITDNFVVDRDGSQVSIKRIAKFNEFRNLQFTQLGNSFEQLQLPSGFIIVEGKTDFQFMNRMIQLRFPNNRINVMNANGDGQVKKKLYDLKEVVGNLSTSPYAGRILVILDETHSPNLKTDLETMGLNNSDLVVWDRNGIEYLYPLELLQKIFCDDAMTADALDMTGDLISHNGINKKKAELCDHILESMTGLEALNEELNAVLVKIDAMT